MTNMITDVMIHTDDTLDDQELSEITTKLASIRGVISFGRSPRLPGFLLVAYNASRVQSKQILDEVLGLGHRAQLVGM